MEVTYFGAGCFWGVEELFRRLDGVVDVCSGYMGGVLDNPSYEDICTGRTGHAEVVKLKFDKTKVTYNELLKLFFRMHDPTTPNQDGPNIGTQYRSIIFYTNEDQKEEACNFIHKLNEDLIFEKAVVTEVTSVQKFYQAEEYHQKFYQKKYLNGHGPICHFLRDIDFNGL